MLQIKVIINWYRNKKAAAVVTNFFKCYGWDRFITVKSEKKLCNYKESYFFQLKVRKNIENLNHYLSFVLHSLNY